MSNESDKQAKERMMEEMVFDLGKYYADDGKFWDVREILNALIRAGYRKVK